MKGEGWALLGEGSAAISFKTKVVGIIWKGKWWWLIYLERERMLGRENVL